MNLTGQPVYRKIGISRSRKPTTADRIYWLLVLKLGCIVGPNGCSGRITIHHCGTGAGGRKDHRRVIPLCHEHHQGRDGIDGREYGMSKKKWQEKHGTEAELLEKTEQRLKEHL